MAKSSPTVVADPEDAEAKDNDQKDSSIIVEGTSDDALADAEGRDRTDGNELQSTVNAEKLVVTNLPDDVLRRAGVPSINSDEFASAVPEPPVAKLEGKDKERRDRFAKLAKVDVGQVLAFNTTTLVGVTDNGGKYQMNRKGTQLRHLAGPVPLGVQSDREQAEQERLEREANREE